MTLIHRYVAFTVPVGWAVLAVWSLVVFVRNKTPGERYWKLLGLLQGILGFQILLGIVLLVVALLFDSGFPPWLHYAYGGLFPIFLLMLAHRWGRDHTEISFVGFGVAALLIAGLTTRALMTGLGMG